MNEHADSRAFTYAVGASLALHAVLLALRAPDLQRPVGPSPAPIVAHIVEPQALEPPPAPPTVEPQPVKPPPQVRKPKPSPKVVRPEPAPPKPSPFTVAPAPAEAPAPAPEPAPAAPPAPAPAAAPPPNAVIVGSTQLAAPDHPATLMARYRSQLIGAAARFKRYPLAARDNGWEGEVEVHVDIGATGEVAGITVKKSSGHAVLDEQALEMFRLAAPQVPLPSGLRGRVFGLDVRAVYSLKD